jgi:integrase
MGLQRADVKTVGRREASGLRSQDQCHVKRPGWTAGGARDYYISKRVVDARMMARISTCHSRLIQKLMRRALVGNSCNYRAGLRHVALLLCERNDIRTRDPGMALVPRRGRQAPRVRPTPATRNTAAWLSGWLDDRRRDHCVGAWKGDLTLPWLRIRALVKSRGR